MHKKVGGATVQFVQPVGILAMSSIVGPKEGEGPLGSKFDKIMPDPLAGRDSWEQAESEFARLAVNLAAEKGKTAMADIDIILAGDLLNQSIGSIFGLRDTNRPYLGIFGACSAIGEGLALGAMLIDGGFAQNIISLATSHFCSAEKQFRFPLEFGAQRPPTSTWTVTGAGAALLTSRPAAASIASATIGKIVDMGVKDANNMGAAMAGAAADTILAHFSDTGRGAAEFDLIITGDLGAVGSDLLVDLMARQGHDIADKHRDCGIEIFDAISQDTHSGGSGCGCAAVTLAAHFLPMLTSGEISRIFIAPTGALMSTTSSQQGESIPSICHGVEIIRNEDI